MTLDMRALRAWPVILPEIRRRRYFCRKSLTYGVDPILFGIGKEGECPSQIQQPSNN